MKRFILPPRSFIVSRAEGAGFEPANVFRRCRFSRPMQSATLPPLRITLLLDLVQVKPYSEERQDFDTGFNPSGSCPGNRNSAKSKSVRRPNGTRKQVVPCTLATFDAVPFVEARNLFNDHIKSLSDGVKWNKAKGRSAGELIHLFLDWIRTNRSLASYYALGDSETF